MYVNTSYTSYTNNVTFKVYGMNFGTGCNIIQTEADTDLSLGSEFIINANNANLVGIITDATNVYIDQSSGNYDYAMLFTTNTATGFGDVCADSQFRSSITFNPSLNLLKNAGGAIFGKDIVINKGSSYASSTLTSGAVVNGINVIANSITFSFGIGTGGTNRGIYDNSKSAWMIYTDNTNVIIGFGSFVPNATNSQSLGSSSLRWSKLYVGTADSYGSGTKPIYWNAGVPKECTYSLESTVNDGTANRMAWYNGANSISATANIQTNGSYIHIINDADISGTAADTSAPFAIGTLTSTHISMDGNEILAKTNATTPGTLYLQDTTGTVQVNGSGGLKVWDINIATDATTDAAKRTISSNSTLYFNSAANASIIFNIGGTEKARFCQPNGYLGLGISAPSYRLHVSGDGFFTGKVHVVGAGNFLGSDGNNTDIYLSTNGKYVTLNNSDNAFRRGTSTANENITLGTSTYRWKSTYNIDEYIGTASGSQCHLNFDNTNKCLRFTFD